MLTNGLHPKKLTTNLTDDDVKKDDQGMKDTSPGLLTAEELL